VRDQRGDVFLLCKVALDVAEPRCVGRGPVTAEIEATAETPSGAREHDGPDGSVDGDAIEGAVQRCDEFARHGIELLRPVQSQLGDAGTWCRDLENCMILFCFQMVERSGGSSEQRTSTVAREHRRAVPCPDATSATARRPTAEKSILIIGGESSRASLVVLVDIDPSP
jgi:hypothetical protein